MLYWEIIAVCSEIHTKHINTLCWQKVEFFSVKPGGINNNHWTLNGQVRKLSTLNSSSALTSFQAYWISTFVNFKEIWIFKFPQRCNWVFMCFWIVNGSLFPNCVDLMFQCRVALKMKATRCTKTSGKTFRYNRGRDASRHSRILLTTNTEISYIPRASTCQCQISHS
jgi:hypothetical protein